MKILIISKVCLKMAFTAKRYGYHFTGQADQVAVAADMTDSVIEIKYIKD